MRTTPARSNVAPRMRDMVRGIWVTPKAPVASRMSDYLPGDDEGEDGGGAQARDRDQGCDEIVTREDSPQPRPLWQRTKSREGAAARRSAGPHDSQRNEGNDDGDDGGENRRAGGCSQPRVPSHLDGETGATERDEQEEEEPGKHGCGKRDRSRRVRSGEHR